MKWLWERLGVTPDSGTPEQTSSVRRIVAALESLPSKRAHYLAAFAFLLGRAAHADLHVSGDEIREMETILTRLGHLPEEQARIVVEIVRHEHRERGSTQNFQVAREFRRLASRDERRELLECLFAVAAADGEISGVEEQRVRQVAEELGFSPREFIEVRSLYNEHRSVIRHHRRNDGALPHPEG